jgi:hypothetical protein
MVISKLYPSSTLLALRSPNPGIVAEAISREKGRGGRSIYALYVEERTGLFVRTANWRPKPEGIEALANAARVAEGEGATLIPIYTVSYNAVEGIVRAAESLGVTCILIGTTQRSAIYHLLRATSSRASRNGFRPEYGCSSTGRAGPPWTIRSSGSSSRCSSR